ncbi:MAG: EVE domain-containing protein [Nitrospiraceae bacterium]
MKRAVQYWLMKSEPEVFSIDDLKRAPGKTTCWEGVRNYQARNFMRSMQIGDRVLFYHSNAEPPASPAPQEVVKTTYPDPTQFDRNDGHFDPASRA